MPVFTEETLSGGADSAAARGMLTVEDTGRRFEGDELREVLALAADVRGFLFAADAMTGKVLRFGPDGSSIEFEQRGLESAIYPIDLASQGAFVYVLDYAGNRILRYDYKGAWLDVLIDFDQFERTRPVSLTVSGGGRLLMTDFENHRLSVWSPLLEPEIVTGEYGWSGGSFDRPAKAAVFGDESIAVAEFGNARVQVLLGSGRFESFLEMPGGRSWVSPRYVCSDPEGFLYVADTGAGAVRVFSPKGEWLADIVREEGFEPSAVAAGWDDLLYVADLRSRSIYIYKLVHPGTP